MQPGQDDPYQQQPPGSYPPTGSYPPPGSGGPAYPPPGSGGPAYPPPPGSGGPAYPPPPGSGGPAYPPPPPVDPAYPPPQPYGAGQPPPYGAPGYGAPGYGAPGYGTPGYGGYLGGPAAPQNTQGLVAMILGIAAIPLVCCWIGLPLGIAAAILGFLGLNKAKAGLATNRSQALTGLICGGVAILLGVAWFIYIAFAGTWNFTTFNT